MYRIRDKPLTAKPGRSQRADKNIEEKPWIDTPTDFKNLIYDPKTDKHCAGFFQMRNLHKKQRLRQANSVRSSNSSNKDSRATSSQKKEISIDQIEILKEELTITWKKCNITEQHIKYFNLNISNIPKIHAAVRIAREIDNIEKGNSNIVSVINFITTREKLLLDFANKFQQTFDKKDLISYIKNINNLRDLTLQLIEYIQLWKKEMNADEEFVWDNQVYFEKLRTDTDFFSDSFLRKNFYFYKSDPFFTGANNPKLYNKKEYCIPIGYKHSSRIKKAIDLLGFEPIKPLKQVLKKLTEADQITTENINTEVTQVLPQEIIFSEQENKKEIQNISETISEELIFYEIHLNEEILVRESFKEIIAASLTLYSSSILDRVITEVLSELIPSVATQSYTEVNDSEYIDIRNLIIAEVMEEQIEIISFVQTNNMISLDIVQEVIAALDLFSLTRHAIQEEMKENLSIVYVVVDQLLEQFLLEDWLEEIAEVEIVQEKMEKLWKDFPAHLQKEIYLSQSNMVLGRVYEMIYFGILNDFIGGFWLQNLVSSVYKACKGQEETNDEEIFVLKDPTVVYDPKKMPFYNRKTR